MAQRRVDIEIRSRSDASGIKGFGRSVGQVMRKLISDFKQGKVSITDMAAALAVAAVALKKIWQTVKRVGRAMLTLAKRGADVTNVLRAFERVTGGAENALKKMRLATQDMISDFDLMVSFNRAVALGAAETVEQFARMSSTAIALGKALNVGPTRALESLTLGIGRQSKLILDNLGIIVSAKKAYADYAKSIGKTASELDDLEKRTAFTNAALDAADRTVAKLGAGGFNLGVVIAQVAAEWTNFTDEVAKAIAKSQLLIDVFRLLGTSIKNLKILAFGIDPATGLFEGFKLEDIDLASAREFKAGLQARLQGIQPGLQNQAGALGISGNAAIIAQEAERRIVALERDQRLAREGVPGALFGPTEAAELDQLRALLDNANSVKMLTEQIRALTEVIAAKVETATDVEDLFAKWLKRPLGRQPLTVEEPRLVGGRPQVEAKEFFEEDRTLEDRFQIQAFEEAQARLQATGQLTKESIVLFQEAGFAINELAIASGMTTEELLALIEEGGGEVNEIWDDIMVSVVNAAAGGGDILITVFAGIMRALAREIQKTLSGMGGILGSLGGPIGAIVGIAATKLMQSSRRTDRPVDVKVINRIRLDKDSEIAPVIVVQITDPGSDRILERFIVESERITARGKTARLPRPVFGGGL